MACLFANTVDFEQFIRVIKSCQHMENGVLMSFSPAQNVFEKFHLKEKELLKTQEGRIFAESGEIKWRRIDRDMRMVYLGAQQDFDCLNDHSKHLKPVIEKRRSDIILWGERTHLENEWIEQQVPHRFNYPIDGNLFAKGRVAIEVENFFDNRGVALFSRFCRVKEIKGETDASR
jgi:hypothetical protein